MIIYPAYLKRKKIKTGESILPGLFLFLAAPARHNRNARRDRRRDAPADNPILPLLQNRLNMIEAFPKFTVRRFRLYLFGFLDYVPLVLFAPAGHFLHGRRICLHPVVARY